MIRVTVSSIRVSLISHQWLVMLKEDDDERYLPIWIGPYEANAIAIKLQGAQMARPMTHDLLRSCLKTIGITISHILVTALLNDTFYAEIVLDKDGEMLKIDSRPSDAIALAVRAAAPIFVAEEVMDRAGIEPELPYDSDPLLSDGDDKLSPFTEFFESLDLGDL